MPHCSGLDECRGFVGGPCGRGRTRHLCQLQRRLRGEKALLTLQYRPCFLVILWCGFDGTAEGCISVAKR